MLMSLNAGMFSVFQAFLEQDDEVIVFEPFFDQYAPNISELRVHAHFRSHEWRPFGLLSVATIQQHHLGHRLFAIT